MRTSSRTAAGPLVLEAPLSGEPGREAIERYVASVYAVAYEARLEHFLPLLVGLRGPDGALVGAIGAQPAAGREPLFLEAYLDAPVEQVIQARTGLQLERSELAEVGNLASHVRGNGRLLLATMAHLLLGLGAPYAVFTATRSLRASFQALGVPLTELALADGARLGPAVDGWGSYYRTDPRVCLVSVELVRAAAQDPVAPCAEAARLGLSLAKKVQAA